MDSGSALVSSILVKIINPDSLANAVHEIGIMLAAGFLNGSRASVSIFNGEYFCFATSAFSSVSAAPLC